MSGTMRKLGRIALGRTLPAIALRGAFAIAAIALAGAQSGPGEAQPAPGIDERLIACWPRSRRMRPGTIGISRRSGAWPSAQRGSG